MRSRLACLGALALFLLTPAAPADAQDCGSWREPVLCQVELQRTDADRRWDRFDPNRSIQVPPNGSIEIELRGRDQNGRTFPQNRIALAYDDRDCSYALEVEDLGEGRLRLEARGSDGRCRLEFWVPGNLNFSWRVDVEVDAGARARYTREEAETVAERLYLGILGREGDAGGLAGAVSQIQMGNVEELVDAMLRSDEFRQSIAAAGPEDILERFYSGIFGRPVDSDGTRTFLSQVQRRQYRDVILALVRSPEFEDRVLR